MKNNCLLNAHFLHQDSAIFWKIALVSLEATGRICKIMGHTVNFGARVPPRHSDQKKRFAGTNADSQLPQDPTEARPGRLRGDMGNMWFYDMLIYCVSFITRVPIYPGWPHTNRPSLVIMYYFYWDILLWPWNTHLLYIHLPIVCHCEWSHKSTIIAFMVHLFLGPLHIYIYTHIHTWILYIYNITVHLLTVHTPLMFDI